MTTATATTTEGQEDLTGKDTDALDGRTPTESILTGQEGDEAVDSAEVEAAMAAGFKRAAGTSARRPNAEEEEDLSHLLDKKTGTEGDGKPAPKAEGEGDDTLPGDPGTPAPEDDPDIPGLGKASEVRARLAELESLKKGAASIAGQLGHLKQLVTSAGQGKKVTADALKRVSEEFGADFANALADDLSTAGFGGGATVDTAAIERMVTEQVTAAREATRREFEKKLVLRAHPDADDHFSRIKLDADGTPVMQKDKAGNEVPVWEPGPKNGAFMAFVQTLPKERQDELYGAGGWDSNVITRALDEFKAHEKKAVSQQATQNERIRRAAVPRGGGGREAQIPVVDPVEQGWQNVRGKRAANPASAGRGR